MYFAYDLWTQCIIILTEYKWADLTPSVHKVLAHSTELINNNMCRGLGHLSEEGLEACHKIIRRFRANWTLQSNDLANLKDLVKKLWLSSDPVFYSYRRDSKCPMNKKKSESDIMVERIFVD